MENNQSTKLVSVRLDIDVLKALDEYVGSSRYVNRSYHINLALRQLFVNRTPLQIYTFLYSNLPKK